jgi:hemolysin activation/secretion protein
MPGWSSVAGSEGGAARRASGGSRRRRGALRLAASIALALLPAAAHAQGAPAQYPVERFELRYAGDTTGLPELESFADTKVTVGVGPGGYVAPGGAEKQAEFRLNDVPGAPAPRFDAGALVAINEQIVAELNRQGLVGVLVAPDAADIDPDTGRDLRAGDGTLTLVVAVARVKGVRTRTVKAVGTLAEGRRFPEEEAVNNPAHEWIREESPLRENDPLRQEPLDNYASWLSRHPGRRVDSVVSPSREPGWVYLDYQVTEGKPWFAYFNYSNTGTDSTTVDRQRFGFTHNQLTNHDDIFRIEYVTGNFDDVHGVFANYQAPIPFTGRKLRGELDFSWNTFDAGEFGQEAFDTRFEGEQWEVGARLLYPLLQYERLFLDVFAGFRFSHIELDQFVSNVKTNDADSSDFFYPTIGFLLERNTATSMLDGRFAFEFNAYELADTRRDLDGLGRIGAERSVQIFRWDLSYSFFLEPLLFPEEWNDPTSDFNSTLAHEIFFWVRGQATDDDRLIPQEQAIAGGLFSVRGYDQSIIAGDALFNLTLEYRLHVPRLFRPSDRPLVVPVMGDFALMPRHEYGFPDWDLILRAFFDTASTTIVKQGLPTPESGELLQGVGLGLELRIKQNFNVRFDWGVGVRSVDLGDEKISAGQSEFHISTTVLF